MPSSSGAGHFLMLSHSYYPDDPRPRRQCTTLAESGWTVDCICLCKGDQPSSENIEGVNVVRLPVCHERRGLGRYIIEYMLFFLLATLAVSKRHLSRKYDVVQVNTPPDFLVFAAFLPRLSGARVMLDMHEPSPEFFAALFGKSLRSMRVRLVAVMERLGAAFAHHIFASCGAARDAFVKRRIPASKITVIPNSCEESMFVPSTNGSDPEAGDEIRLIYHGTIIERYGIDTAIRAVRRLRESRKNVHLDIYGEGEQIDDLRSLIRALRVEDAVHIHGWLTPEEIPQKIARAHIGLIPYKRDIFTDLVLPNKLFEYVAMKKPFIVSPIRAILDHYPPSLLNTFPSDREYELAREVIRIQENADETKRRSEELYERYRTESWEEIGRSYLAIIEGSGPLKESI